MMPDLPPVVICHVVAVHDADTIRCANGVKGRLAGVSGRELNNSCNSAPDCPTMPGKQAAAVARKLLLGRTIRFKVVGRSYDRLVLEHMLTRCTLNASGATVPWRYWERRYNLRRCD